MPILTFVLYITTYVIVVIAHFIPAALLFVAGYAGCQALGAAWLGIAALLVSGTAPAGALAAIADLAPAESPACAAAACALCSTLGAAGLLAANYFVTQALHGSVSRVVLLYYIRFFVSCPQS